MKRAIEAADALNEVGWWSSWASAFRPAEGAYALSSGEFEEPLFNRVFFTRPPKPKDLEKIAKAFAARGARPSFFVLTDDRYSGLRKALRAEGFRKEGGFHVMEERRLGVSAASGVDVHEASGKELEAWSRTYLKVFYGDEALLPLVLRCVRRAKADESDKLVVAEQEGGVVGTMALHTDEGCTGLYCLGTVPDRRGGGVAGSLLAFAHSVKSDLGTKLVLQVFESDGVEQFYLRRGYERVLSEEIFRRDQP